MVPKWESPAPSCFGITGTFKMNSAKKRSYSILMPTAVTLSVKNTYCSTFG